MGEAKRRRQAGTVPLLDNPPEALHRFWCGRPDAGPVEDFRAPIGTVAITLDIHGAAPSTCLIDATKLVDVMGDIGRLSEARDYYWVVRAIASEFLRAKQTGAEAPFLSLGLAAFWTALHHPQLGAPMRDAVSESLRRRGRAHITWQFSPTTGLAMALAEAFVDLEGVAELAATSTPVCIAVLPGDASETQH
jgi:hypothetical protein